MTELIFYTRSQCPLCTKAKDVLEVLGAEHDISIKEIDIHSSDELVERFGLMIPVVEWKGEVLQYGQIDGAALIGQLGRG
ncbi:glutaredoxin family protein [Peribacillus sp. SCS-26]|uniref:glutaredoxin family protein n=1 Tax=Paraperibacillus marinus TaxID=3115295 RepID=UPI00390602C5